VRQKWIVLKHIKYVDAEIPKDAVVEQLDPESLPSDFRAAFDRARSRIAADHPGRTLIAIEWEGKPRWVTAPIDVRMHLARRPGVLPRRRVYRDGDQKTPGGK
jgi:hypothetical protein